MITSKSTPLDNAPYAQHFTVKYFHSQVLELRKLMGEKTFWAKSAEIRQHAVDALGFVFLNLVADDGDTISPEENQKAADIYYNTIDEYSRREVHTVFKVLA